MKIYLNEEGTQTIDSIIYKYAGINQNLYSLLINNEIWFSNPADFNDPYDCNLKYNFSEINYEKVYNHLSESNKKFNKGATIEYLKDRTLFICNNPEELNKLLGGLLQESTDNRGISCFSESDTKLLMWSHYADSHKGVCLTFDIERDLEFFRNPYKVDYPNDYPIINPFNNNQKREIPLFFATKSQEWAYEEEIRIIKEKNYHPKFRGNIEFKPEALREIKFGYKASNEQIKTIRNLAIKKYPQIKLYGSKLKDGHFGIEFYPID